MSRDSGASLARGNMQVVVKSTEEVKGAEKMESREEFYVPEASRSTVQSGMTTAYKYEQGDRIITIQIEE